MRGERREEGRDVRRLDRGLHAVEGGDAGAAAFPQGDPAAHRTVGGDGGCRPQQAGPERVQHRAVARLEVTDWD